MNTPTPRTDAVYLQRGNWANEEELRDLARKLERELATERARMDWCIHHNHLVMSAATGFSGPLKYQVIVYDLVGAQTFETGFFDTEREAIDAAMKEGAK